MKCILLNVRYAAEKGLSGLISKDPKGLHVNVVRDKGYLPPTTTDKLLFRRQNVICQNKIDISDQLRRIQHDRFTF
jgi:hypothetical protein